MTRNGENGRCRLSLWHLVRTDWSVFLLVFGPLFFFIVALIVFIAEEYPFVGYQRHEIAFSVAAILGASTMFWPFVAWWYAVARRTVTRNIKVRAAVTRVEQTKGPYFGICSRALRVLKRFA